MPKHFLAMGRATTVALTLMMSLAARAEPIQLKLSFFTSDRSSIYQNSIKPFVDAVNRDGEGLVDIKVYFSGAISRNQADQPKLVADGTADLALVVPGRTPKIFPDTAVMELPGLYYDQLQASLVYNRLIELGALEGYKEFYVVGAFVADAESIHSRKPIASIDGLRGLAIRTNNNIEAATLERFGAKPVPLAINETTDAISAGKIDGATFPTSMLFEFGVARIVRYNYMIQLGGVPTVLIMNRKKFESLPAQAQAIIRKYSGKWLAEQSAAAFDALDKKTLAQLEADPRRKVVFPSSSDLASSAARIRVGDRRVGGRKSA